MLSQPAQADQPRGDSGLLSHVSGEDPLPASAVVGWARLLRSCIAPKSSMCRMIARKPAAISTDLPISGIFSDNRLNCLVQRQQLGRPFLGRPQRKCRDDRRTVPRSASVGRAGSGTAAQHQLDSLAGSTTAPTSPQRKPAAQKRNQPDGAPTKRTPLQRNAAEARREESKRTQRSKRTARVQTNPGDRRSRRANEPASRGIQTNPAARAQNEPGEAACKGNHRSGELRPSRL